MRPTRADGGVSSRRCGSWRRRAARNIPHAAGRRRRDRLQRPLIPPTPAARAGSAQPARVPHPRAHRDVVPRRSIGLVILIIPPALDAAVLAQPARVPGAGAYLGEDPRRRIALPIVIHPPANSLTTLAHSAGMRRPGAHLRENPLRSVSPPKAAAPPAGNLARRSQPASVQIPRANRAESPLRRLRLPIVEHAAPETLCPPALDRAAHLAHRTSKMPAHGNIAERAARRVRVSAPASDPAILPPDCAVVPFAGADCAVAAFGDFEQICVSVAPATNPAGDVQRASVIAPSIECDVAVRRSRRSGLGKSQNTKQQRSERQGDQEEFMPLPPDRASAAAPRQARRATVRKPAMCVTPQTLHQRNPSAIPARD